MQSKDIQVGTEYAYVAWKHAPAKRVKVLEVGVPMAKQSYSSSRGTSGVKVEHSNGTQAVVRSQTIDRLWSEQVEANKQAAEYARERAISIRNVNAERAQIAFALHTALEAAGRPVKTGYCFREEHHKALVRAGFKVVEGDTNARSNLVSTVYNLSDVMDGKVSLADVAVLLGVKVGG